MSITLIIPAAGSGKRLGAAIPKQYLELNNKPVIIETLLVFEQQIEIDNIIIAINPDWQEFLEKSIKKWNINKVSSLVTGGAERQDSVWNCLGAKEIINTDLIMIHDAVRPFVASALINDIINAANIFGAAIPAILPKDTIKKVDNNSRVINTLDRASLRAVQTPQCFKKDILIQSYRKCYNNVLKFTDDASIVEFSGYNVQVIEGDETNIKLTSKLDFDIAELIFRNKKG